VSVALTGLVVRGDRTPWERLGFRTGEDGVGVDAVWISFRGDDDGPGMSSWELTGDGPPSIDGLATTWTSDAVAVSAVAAGHPNGTTRLDHVVVMTDDLDRTIAALTDAGLEHRRTRSTGTPERPVRQAFFWLGDVILEVVGDVPHEQAGARFWGLVAVVPDVDAVATQLGPDLVGAPKDAVQRGRRIVTVRPEAGLSVPLAFLTPHVRDGT